LRVPVLRRVFAHGRNPDTVFELDAPQLEWAKQTHRISL
jgi:hypothetical protein